MLKSAADRAEEIKCELRSEISQRGLSERALADELGFGPTYLTNLFVASPGRMPTALKLETSIALLEMLDLNLVEFLSCLESKPEARGKGPKRGASTDERHKPDRGALGRKDYELLRELLGIENGERSDQVRELARRTIEFVKRHSGAPARQGKLQRLKCMAGLLTRAAPEPSAPEPPRSRLSRCFGRGHATATSAGSSSNCVG